MKIAIATNNDNLEGIVSNVGARAPFYLILEDKKIVKKLKNPFLHGGGAGFSVAQMLNNENVDVLISGNIGGRMLDALNNKKIKSVVKSGPIKKALNEVLE